MAPRGKTRDVVINPIIGWKIEYGFKGLSSMGPSTLISSPLSSERVRDAMAATVGDTLAPTLFNLDALQNPQDGKTLMSDSFGKIAAWTQLDYVQRILNASERRLRPYFRKMAIPSNVEAVFVTVIFRLNIKKYPVLKGARFTISIPVKGEAKKWMNFSLKGGDSNG